MFKKSRQLAAYYSRKHRSFLVYSGVGIAFTFAHIILIYLLIDILHVPTLLSATIVAVGLFLLRYSAYKRTGFTRDV